MPASTVTTAWKAIRPLNGSRANRVEELCTQLAHVESPAGTQFARKTPHSIGFSGDVLSPSRCS
jgi:hypothetical protein